jgi:glutathionylspermidine synthase
MKRVPVAAREDWRQTAEAHGFSFHTLEGDPYWDETAYYAFTLEEIENDLEEPAEEIEQMCYEAVAEAVGSEQILESLKIPPAYWDLIADSWRQGHRNLYGRMDFSYDGAGPARLLEYNADTPTSLYESAIFQWVWLEQAMERGLIPDGCDQFNSLHEKLVGALARFGIEGRLHFACARDSEEDRGTVEYLEDCAKQAGLETGFLYMDEIGIAPGGEFTDLDDLEIRTLFKLYPWEWLMDEPFGEKIAASNIQFIEPAWKAVLSNKAVLALLWDRNEGHPNLLPTYLETDARAGEVLGSRYAKKPFFSREGWDVSLVDGDKVIAPRTGQYGAEGHVLQALAPLAEADGNHAMLGCWVVASEAAGMCIREDRTPVTSDDARFVPHVILP